MRVYRASTRLQSTKEMRVPERKAEHQCLRSGGAMKPWAPALSADVVSSMSLCTSSAADGCSCSGPAFLLPLLACLHLFCHTPPLSQPPIHFEPPPPQSSPPPSSLHSPPPSTRPLPPFHSPLPFSSLPAHSPPPRHHGPPRAHPQGGEDAATALRQLQVRDWIARGRKRGRERGQ